MLVFSSLVFLRESLELQTKTFFIYQAAYFYLDI
jgi:hypothetical protein